MAPSAAMLTFVITSPAALEAEGDLIFASHAAMMRISHYRSGDKALLHYNVAKSTGEDGRVTFVLNEVYARHAGLDDHLARRGEWKDLDAFHAWLGECEVTAVLDGRVLQSLW